MTNVFFSGLSFRAEINLYPLIVNESECAKLKTVFHLVIYSRECFSWRERDWLMKNFVARTFFANQSRHRKEHSLEQIRLVENGL